jgi:hypothetical protein
MLNASSVRGDDCDTVHYLMVAKVREILVVSKPVAQSLMEKDLI